MLTLLMTLVMTLLTLTADRDWGPVALRKPLIPSMLRQQSTSFMTLMTLMTLFFLVSQEGGRWGSAERCLP